MADENKFNFVPFAEEHLALLQNWLAQPHVAEFWQETNNEAELREKFLHNLHERGVKPYVILLGDKPIGYIQSYEAVKVGGGWWASEKAGVHGVDQFIGDPALLGKGHGTKLISEFLQALFFDHAVTEVITDPDPKNARAIRAYEKVGFLKEGETTTPGGPAILFRLTRDQFLGSAARQLELSDAVREFQRVAGAYSGFWCVAGGWACDLFLGYKTRGHEDLEIVALREDESALYQHFHRHQPSKIFAGEPPRFEAWKGEPIEREVIQLRLAPLKIEGGIVDFDLLLTPSEGGQWICRRDEALRLPLERVRAFAGGIPFLKPEIVLLFKAKRVEEKDQRDFENVSPQLGAEARQWLAESLARLYPEHEWLSQLR
jgi:RimJ/RimL family protein N-acetyltransferase